MSTATKNCLTLHSAETMGRTYPARRGRIAKLEDFPHAKFVGPDGQTWTVHAPVRCLACGRTIHIGDRIAERGMGAYFIHAACANEGAQ